MSLWGTPVRVAAPIACGLGCLVIAGFTGPIAAWLLIIAAFGLILDGATMLLSKGAGGALREHRHWQ